MPDIVKPNIVPDCVCITCRHMNGVPDTDIRECGLAAMIGEEESQREVDNGEQQESTKTACSCPCTAHRVAIG